VTFELAASPDAPARARASVLAVVGDSRSVDDILLALSELVSNAVRHGDLSPDDVITVDVETSGEVVRVTVSHDGPPFDPLSARTGGGLGGFGLRIVGAVSKRWDVSHRDGRTETWFEV
jgi:anti-sigma regulatory factor (Ser/Thr protein kinase)